eukprot:3010439-Pleurochrysis_carterae.AAC.1
MSNNYDTVLQQLADTGHQHQAAVEALAAKLEAAKSEASEMRAAAGIRPGRPAGRQGREAIESKWLTMSREARRKALLRHSNEICRALMSCGCIDWLPCSFAVALKSLGMFDELMGTRAVAEVKLQLVTDLRDILSAEWGASLALFVKDEL